jgi:hypothetical protein
MGNGCQLGQKYKLPAVNIDIFLLKISTLSGIDYHLFQYFSQQHQQLSNSPLILSLAIAQLY